MALVLLGKHIHMTASSKDESVRNRHHIDMYLHRKNSNSWMRCMRRWLELMFRPLHMVFALTLVALITIHGHKARHWSLLATPTHSSPIIQQILYVTLKPWTSLADEYTASMIHLHLMKSLTSWKILSADHPTAETCFNRLWRMFVEPYWARAQLMVLHTEPVSFSCDLSPTRSEAFTS